jgi:ATP-dependent Lon protease
MAKDIPFSEEEIEIEEDESDEKEQAHWYGFEEDVEDVPVADSLPILPLRGVVVFPAAIVPLLISRDSSLSLVEQALVADRVIGLVAQKSPEQDAPAPEDLFRRGCAGRILKMLKYPDGSIRILVQGLRRIEVRTFTQTDPYLIAEVAHLEDGHEAGIEVQALKTQAVQGFSRFVELTPYLPNELQVVVINLKKPGKISDLIASNLNLPLDEKQVLLETLDVDKRLLQLNSILAREIELLELGQKIQGQVQTELTRNQKEFYLRQQLKAIQKELGEPDARQNEVEMLRRRIEEAGLGEEARKAAEAELDRLAIIPPESAEHTVVRTYVEWLADLPWSVSTQDNLDTVHARKILDEDHFDLEKIKDRILEFLAVRQLRNNPRGPILCLVGPPGVGKTSLGRSIARAMGRKFSRLSLGGMRDEAEIRGHRRTYVGAMPGRIIQGLKSAGSNNPVFMLDEIDKVGSDGIRGDPSSALLEVLDPEQNSTFRDHYLDVPFDLQKVLFLTTANILDPIPPALKDRMEVLELSGYSEEEKLEIANRHLIPKQIRENGLEPGFVTFTHDGVVAVIRDYTKEAGLRNLEREIGAICRKIARAVSEGRRDRVTVDAGVVATYLGPPRFVSEIADRAHRPGVAIGLAWTPHGGDILFIEAAFMKGTKALTLTGQLGNVMKESAQAALTYLRSNADVYGINAGVFNDADIHVHVPAGAIPKDGPSAGITMLVALASTFKGIAVRERVAMTGEITLRGAVLPVGGIKEKVLAARRAGVREIYLPERNRKDLEDIDPVLRDSLEFHFVDEVDDVLREVFATPEIVSAVEPAAARAH